MGTMKIWLAIAVLAIIGAILAGVYAFGTAPHSMVQSAKGPTLPSSAPNGSASSQTSSSSVFHGPIGAPHIKGPTGPPPAY